MWSSRLPRFVCRTHQSVVYQTLQGIPSSITSVGCKKQQCTMSTSTQPTTATSLQPSAKSAIDFLMLLHNLKTTKRTGWVIRGIKGPESIADHMYRMGMMSLIAGDCGVDCNRCVKMALVHDVAEAIVGDITPHCKISPEEKHRREREAIEHIQQMLGPDTTAAKEVLELWHEYEAAASPEALLVKDFDKLEMIIQAHEYESSQDVDLQEFFNATKERFKTPTGCSWAMELVARRQAAREQRQQQQ